MSGDSSESEYEPPDSLNDSEIVDLHREEQPRRSSRTSRRRIDYGNDGANNGAVDDFFEGVPGYTSFSRTRKGGDRRPRSAGKDNKVRRGAPGTCTLLNFFSVGDSLPTNTPPKPKTAPKRKAKTATKNLPTKTRTRNSIGRPKKLADVRKQRVQQLASRLKSSCASASLATTPQHYKKWGGSVISKMLHIVIFFFSFQFLCARTVQMKQKVKRLTDTFLHEGGGNQKLTAQLFANFSAQRVVSPFQASSLNVAPQQIFGENALATLQKAKQISQKPGCPADMLRRAVIVAGAEGPISPNPVSNLPTCMEGTDLTCTY